MRTLEEVQGMIERWHDSDSVGTFMAYRYPGAREIEVIQEVVIKKDEMPVHVQESFYTFMNYYGIEKGEIFRNKKGEPDRVKFTRRIDV